KLYIDVIEAYLKRAQYFEQSGNYKWMFMAVKGCMCQYYYMSKENEKCWGEKEVQDSYQRCRTFIERHRNNTREMKCRLQMMLFCMNIHLYNGMCRWVIKVRDNIL
ncbi:MAG: hypothetical protein SPF70_11585, partial [Lachnospiraceae bacterium]|nr:hypothetical protein [Lachnospiraceae bacterium]